MQPESRTEIEERLYYMRLRDVLGRREEDRIGGRKIHVFQETLDKIELVRGEDISDHEIAKVIHEAIEEFLCA